MVGDAKRVLAIRSPLADARPADAKNETRLAAGFVDIAKTGETTTELRSNMAAPDGFEPPNA
jgi:hypothetical protein